MSCKTGGTYRYRGSVNVNHGSCVAYQYVGVMCVLFIPFHFVLRLFTADVWYEAEVKAAQFQFA
jgi:hypothetical protein